MTHVVFEPLELIERLAALVPPPRFNLVRYHGILAPAARLRASVVPAGNAETQRRHSECVARVDPPCPSEQERPVRSSTDRQESAEPAAHPRRYAWAELMRRVFAVDVLECPRCDGAMRILAAIHPSHATRAILECLGLSTRPPPVASPESPYAETCLLEI